MSKFMLIVLISGSFTRRYMEPLFEQWNFGGKPKTMVNVQLISRRYLRNKWRKVSFLVFIHKYKTHFWTIYSKAYETNF